MRLITFKELGPKKGVRYTRDHLRVKIKNGEFPQPIQLSDSRIAWIESEIDDWITQRAELRDQHQAVA
jgi:prophage regulatory protein